MQMQNQKIGKVIGTVYVAGPMRGLPGFNFAAFDAAAQGLRGLGYEVINPADLDRAADPGCEAITNAEATARSRVYAKRDTEALLKCTHIAMLPGWENSTGATAEYHFAKWIGLTILDATSGEPLVPPKPMTREELLSVHDAMCRKGRELMQAKNRDYAGDHGNSPFANFTRTEALGISSTEAGMLVRMTDKLSRLSSFVESGRLYVASESVEDSLIDVINYAVLFGAYLKDKQRRTPQKPVVEPENEESILAYIPMDGGEVRPVAIFTSTEMADQYVGACNAGATERLESDYLPTNPLPPGKAYSPKDNYAFGDKRCCINVTANDNVRIHPAEKWTNVPFPPLSSFTADPLAMPNASDTDGHDFADETCD